MVAGGWWTTTWIRHPPESNRAAPCWSLGGRGAGPPEPGGRRQGGGRRREAEVPGQDGWRAWVQPCRRAGAPAPLGGVGRGLLTLGRATYLHPAGPGAKCPLPPLPHPGASALTGPASQRPSESSRVPDPSLQRSFSTPAPHSQVGSRSSQVFATSVFLAGAGDRARCYLPPPPVRALRATRPTPRDFQGLRFPSPRQMKGPLSSGQGSVGDVRTKTLNFSFFPP